MENVVIGIAETYFKKTGVREANLRTNVDVQQVHFLSISQISFP